MKTTTVRISMAVKRQLDTLQARLTILSGRAVPKEEVLELLVRRAAAAPADLLGTPSEPAGWHRLRGLIQSTGVDTREEDIDAALYGGDP